MTPTLHDFSASNALGKVALLVIDVQQGLFERSAPIYRAEQLLENIQLLIHNARQAGAAVFFIQHANESLLVEGSAAWQLHAALEPLESETILHKRHGNAFQETALQELLEAGGVEQLVIAGLVTYGCVRATCIGALELGYQVVLVEDGHSSWHKQAGALIEEWNQKLNELGATLRKASQVDFHSKPETLEVVG